MIFVGKSFNNMTYFVKKVEGLRKVGQVNVLAKSPKSVGTFHGSYYRGLGRPVIEAWLVQLVMPASTGGCPRTSQQNPP